MPRRPRLALLAAVAGLTPCAVAGAAAGAPAAVSVELAPGVPPAALGAAAEPAVSPALVARYERRLGRPLPELRRRYRVAAAGVGDARRIARRLAARPGVEAAVEPAPAPPPAICRGAPEGGWPAFDPGLTTPDLSGLQDYRAGLGLPDGWDGEGVAIANVEYEWRGTHEELEGLGLPPSLPSPFAAEDHGTAVLGVLAADADAEGITGLAHEAAVVPVSPYAGEGAPYDIADAILRAGRGLGPGDVLLIEQQLQDRLTGDLIPVEALDAAREAIRAVVATGVVVVEPAGNGGRTLAGLGIPGPSGEGYSGALMVGAGGSAATGADLRRTARSNFGERVDVQGFGAGVLTAGYGEVIGVVDDPDRRYTACFDGTSSASATIAGAVAALQGTAIEERGAPLTPAQVRDALVATGIPQPADDIATPIGPRPQVAAALAAAPPPPPPPPPPPAADGDAVPAAPAPSPGPAAAAPPAPLPATTRVQPRPRRARAAVRPAATGLAARIDRRRDLLTLVVRRPAPRAVVRVAGHTHRVVRGRVVLRRAGPGRLLVRISAPRVRGVAVRARAYRVIVPRTGPARVLRGAWAARRRG